MENLSSKKNSHFVKLAVLVLSVFAFSYGQTAQHLQSARIYSGFSLGMVASTQKYIDIIDTYSYNDSVYSYYSAKQKGTSGYPYILRNGIRDRVELSYTGLLFLLTGFIELGIKVKCFEYGEPSLFKNITLTLSGNFSGVSGERSRTSEKWGGLIISTTHRFKTVDLDLVIEPCYSNYKWHYSKEFYGNDERLESFNLSSGLVARLDFNPVNRFYLEIITGFNWQHVYDSHYLAYRDEFNSSTRSDSRKVLFHTDDILSGDNFGGNFSLAFNWLKKKNVKSTTPKYEPPSVKYEF